MTEEQRKNHPVWELYDLQRDCALNSLVYLSLTDRYSKIIFWLDIVTALFAGSSAIAGFSFWKTLAGHQVWIVGSGCATVIAGLKPVLRLTDKLKRYQDLYSRYVMLEAACANLSTQVKNARTYSNANVNALIKLRERAAAIAASAPVVKYRDSFIRKIQAKVTRLMPPEQFYIPET